MAIGDFDMNTKVIRPTENLERQVRTLDAKVEAIGAQLNRIEKLLGDLAANRNDTGQ